MEILVSNFWSHFSSSVCVCVYVCVCARSVLLIAAPWTVACQASLSMGFPG